MGRDTLSTRDRARLVLVVSIALTALLYIVPFGHLVAYPLMLLSTLVHELGHGVTAVLWGGQFDSFVMWSDGSGAARSMMPPSRLGQAAVAAGGLVGPAMLAAFAFAFGRTARGARACLWFFSLSLALALILVVRNPFGILFVGVVLGLCLLVVLKGTADLQQLMVIFVAVQLALSVFSRGDYLFTRQAITAQGVMPSDVGLMADALLLPYWFWGALCGAFSIFVLLYGLQLYWRR